MSIKFDTRLNREEMHLISKLDAEMFFNNAKEVYVERPTGIWAGKVEDSNMSLAMWLMTGDERESNMKPVYVVFEFEIGGTKFKNIYIARHYKGNYKSPENFREVYRYNIVDLQKNGWDLKDEYDYNTVAKFLNNELYYLYYKEYSEAGYGDSMFAGWKVV